MAKIGMAYPAYAEVASETYGTSITYETGVMMEHAMSANVAINRSDKKMYGDNRVAEQDNSVTGYDITLELTQLSNADRAALLGETAYTGSGSTVEYYDVGGDSAPYVGVGYIQVLLVDGVKSYEAYWFHKVKFALESEDANTKEDEVDFKSTTLKGTGCAVDIGSGESFYHHMNFATESAALVWLKGKANITT